MCSFLKNFGSSFLCQLWISAACFLHCHLAVCVKKVFIVAQQQFQMDFGLKVFCLSEDHCETFLPETIQMKSFWNHLLGQQLMKNLFGKCVDCMSEDICKNKNQWMADAHDCIKHTASLAAVKELWLREDHFCLANCKSMFVSWHQQKWKFKSDTFFDTKGLPGSVSKVMEFCKFFHEFGQLQWF